MKSTPATITMSDAAPRRMAFEGVTIAPRTNDPLTVVAIPPAAKADVAVLAASPTGTAAAACAVNAVVSAPAVDSIPRFLSA